MEDLTRVLVDELCSLLDESTILSICHDYDLENPKEFAAAREVLLAIAKDVEAEEASGFNPSGLGGDDLAGFSVSNEGVGSGDTEGDLQSNDGLTTTTESSNSRSRKAPSSSSSKASMQETPSIFQIRVLDHLTWEEKEQQLAAMFVSLNSIDIKLTLQKVNGDADLAIDELLSLQMLEQTGQRPKGVDGFFVSDEDVPKSKKKGKRKAAKASKVVPPKSPDTITASEEFGRRGAVDNDNISFISDRFGLPIADATDLYRRNKSSLGTAIVSLLDNCLALNLHPGSSFTIQPRYIEEQKKRIPWIPDHYFAPIFETTASFQAAVDVVDALSTYFKRPAHVKYNLSYNVVASGLEGASEVPLPTSPVSSWRVVPASLTRQKAAGHPRPGPTALQEAGAAKAVIAASRDHSSASASAAFKKGRSDPLMRQAAGYYADRARAEAADYRRANAAEASLLVDSRSTPGTIDLHGVSVQDGVDIAVDRVRRWWDALGAGEQPRRAARRDGLKVVTGLGRHNPDGRSPLRINVFKALVADGWKVEVLTGAYLVTGRA